MYHWFRKVSAIYFRRFCFDHGSSGAIKNENVQKSNLYDGIRPFANVVDACVCVCVLP